ncbi:MAG: hypothetical protein ACRDCE_19920 [Cetobacterium sp.]|uniref:hypothetical protein n=1 Tax=Cetobacterium sp. TaxID=2071632 RepID=UPI003EE6A735
MSKQGKNDSAYRQRRVLVSKQTARQSQQVKDGVKYSQRRFDTIQHLHYVMSNPKDPDTKQPLFTVEQRYQARKHMRTLIANETALNGGRKTSLQNDIRSWNEKGSKSAFGKQKAKGSSKPPKGW